MEHYTKSDFIESVATELIQKLPDFECIRTCSPAIAYMESDKAKKKSGGRVFADCEKVKPKMKEFMAYDYIITAYIPNCEELTPNQWYALIYHELLHVDCSMDGDDNLVCKIRPHNIEDFHEVTDRFGTYWADDDSIDNIVDIILSESKHNEEKEELGE